jgi:hypothetical protein
LGLDDLNKGLDEPGGPGRGRLCGGRPGYRLVVRLGRGCFVAALVTALLAAAAPASHAAEPDIPAGVIAIGDSVMLGARSELRKRGVRVIDAKVGRQVTSAPALMRKRGAALPKTVVVHLGTNGTFPRSACRDMVRAAGPQRQIVLLTVKVPRRWQRTNNSVIRRCAAAYPRQVTVVDWHWASSRHRSWLYSDGYHLPKAGARNYARLIGEGVKKARAKDVRLLTGDEFHSDQG